MKKFKVPKQSSSLSPLTHEEMQNISDKKKERIGTCKCNISRAGKGTIIFLEECCKESSCPTHCDAIAATYEDCIGHTAQFGAYSECPGSPFCRCGSDCKCPHKGFGSGSGSGSDESDGEEL